MQAFSAFRSVLVTLTSPTVELASPCFVNGVVSIDLAEPVLLDNNLVSIRLSGTVNAPDVLSAAEISFLELSMLNQRTVLANFDHTIALEDGTHTFPFQFIIENGALFPPSICINGKGAYFIQYCVALE
ncbi:hypothetical protein BJ742DRAFT_888451 [Cladochytrium replicatum]|nr:hypothetical protein BJ742DRAFT_888451 [Cladochytrium replicatum]